MTQLLGYARVSTADQAPELQLDELREAGCARIWTDHATSTRGDRPQLARVLSTCAPATPWWSGAWTASRARSAT